MPKTIWFVDENENQSKTYVRTLKKLVPNEIDVKPILPPFEDMNRYAELLVNPETVCIILDQRLNDTGYAAYTGIQLAQYLRAINGKIPIYILTNFPLDLTDGEASTEYELGVWSVDDIIDKADFKTEGGSETFRARLLRRLDVYDDVMAAHIMRFRELLEKKVAGELTASEEKEYGRLQFERLAAEEVLSEHSPSGLEEFLILNDRMIEALNRLSVASDDE